MLTLKIKSKMMKLLPIEKDGTLDKEFTNNSECMEMLSVFRDLYLKVGFEKPWIGYFAALENNEIIGIAGFKGKPKNGKVEISYGTFKEYRQKGIGTKLCEQLVLLSLKTNKKIKITARTLPENNPSTRILKVNGFEFSGPVWDKEDGYVWEWEYKSKG